MRRISLAVALIGAVAAAGCGGGTKPAAKNGAQGTAGVNFTVTVNNQGPGTVVSVPAGINCSAVTPPSGVAPAGCSFTFPSGTAVVLTGTPTGTNYFNGFFGGCSGNTCSLSGDADKYVVSYFSATPQVHPNFNDGAVHSAAYSAVPRKLDCALCHGPGASGPTMADVASNMGLGIAVACSQCHQGAGAGTLAAGEKCAKCHLASGSSHQARYDAYADGINPATTKFAVSNVSVASSAGTNPGTFKATVTFTLKKGGQPFITPIANLKQKTVYFVAYDATNKKFLTPSYKQTADVDPTGEIGGSNTESVNFSFGSWTLVDAATGTWTAIKDNLPTDPLADPRNANAFVYGYFGDANVPSLEGNLNPGGRHYALMDNMVSFSKVVKGTIGYTSTATVSGCERCHGAPYSKHGYRQAAVAGLNDFVACKACHTDFRRGTDAGWYLITDVPNYAGAAATAADKLKYAYTANVMQDTHNSHSFEFAYPQSMANCTTCHEGKLNLILTDANFVGTTCKSCHPTTNTLDIEKRPPSFAGPVLGPKLAYHNFNWVDVYAAGVLVAPAGTINEGGGVYLACNACHADDIADGTVPGVHLDPADPKAHDGVGPILFGAPVPLFKDIHSGKLASVYKADGSKYSATAKAQIDSIVVDKAAKKVTVAFSVVGAPAGASIKPTVVGSLYGYNTKDFIVGGHSSVGSPSARILEYTEGATNNGPRLVVSGGIGSGPWTAVADLSDATVFPQVANGSATKMELGFLPAVTLADGTTSVAIAGLTATIDFTVDGPAAPVVGQYGKDIVDAAKCNKCHEALGTTFHSPSYGSAGVVGCRLCHVVGSGGSHLEMQSRSIDSYVHAIHSYQYFDIKDVNFSDMTTTPSAASHANFEYEEHILSVYPNFSIQNCESCHNPGTYNIPAQDKALPSVLSAAAVINPTTVRNITVPSVVVGPAARACGSCHVAKFINETVYSAAAITELTDLQAHMGGTAVTSTGNGYRLAAPATLSTVIADLVAAGLLP